MAILNFPPTAGEPIDGSFTYSSDGVTYSWDGYKWTADTGSGGGGDANHNDGPTPPTTGELADQWYNTDDGRLYTYTADSSGTLVWIDASPDSIASGSGGSGGDGTTINYNGASAWGSAAADGTINNGQNVASVTKTGTGIYDVVFTTPMANAEYAVNVTAQSTSRKASAVSKTVNGFTVDTCLNGETTRQDANFDFAVHSENAIAPQSGVGADSWGKVLSTGDLVSGFNCTVTRPATGRYEVLFNEPLPNANYAIVGSTYVDGNRYFSVKEQSPNGFTYDTKNGADGSNLNIDAYFAVFASSTVTPTYTWTRDGTTLKPANAGDGIKVDGQATFGLQQTSPGNLSITTAGVGGGQALITLQSGSDVFNSAQSGIAFGGGVGNHRAFIYGGHTNAGNTVLAFQTSDFAGGAENPHTKMLVNSDGNIFIGGDLDDLSALSPTIQLRADGQSVFSNKLSITNGPGGKTNFKVAPDGSMVFNGTLSAEGLTGSPSAGQTLKRIGSEVFVDTSTRASKENIVPLVSSDAIEVTKALRPVNYVPKGGGDLQIGFIAEEVLEVLPSAAIVENGEAVSVAYDRLSAICISALQQAVTRIETLEETNASLEARLTALEGGNN